MDKNQNYLANMEEDPKWGASDRPGEERSGGAQQKQQQPSKQSLWRNWRDLFGVTVCIALSVLCIGVCVVVFVRTSVLQSRIVSLEQQQRDAQLSAWMRTVEQVEPVIMGRLDGILEEVSALQTNQM